MMIPLQRSTATALLALLLQGVKPALTQSSLGAAPTGVPPNYADEHPSIYQEYNFTYPGYLTGEATIVSYKDTIDVSWTSMAPSDPPSLTIRCWIRNATTSPLCMYLYSAFACTITDRSADSSHYPNLTTTLVSGSEATMSDFPLNLTTYKPYSPCELLLQDPRNISAENTVFSNPFFISETNHSAGVTWSTDNPAPVQMGTEGLGGRPESSEGHLRVRASSTYTSVAGALLMLWIL